MFASGNSHTAIVKLLIKKGANLNLRTNNSDALQDFEKNATALQFARNQNHTEIVQLLQQARTKE